MTNPYYAKTGNPGESATGSSAVIRAEFTAIEAGFDKLPTLSGAGNRVVHVNSGATALTTTSGFTFDGTTLTVPTLTVTTVSGTLLTLAVTDSGFSIKDNSDNTKVLAFECTNIPTATTRTLYANESADLGSPTLGAQGRLTLTTATSVTTSDVTGATTVYFTPHKGNKVELYNGTSWPVYTFTELSQATTDATKSPAAVTTNSNYDVFVWNDSGTLRATRGPAWSSGTARGTGAGTTELELFEGRYVNKVAITNGPAARRGLYVGTIRTDGSSQVNDSLAKRHVWNNYNRVERAMSVTDTTASWTYSTATWRQVRATATNQLDIVRGLNEDAVFVRHSHGCSNNNASNLAHGVGIGLDSTSSPSGVSGYMNTNVANSWESTSAIYVGLPGLGNHYFAALEIDSSATATTTWYGSGTGMQTQGIVATVKG